MPELIFTPWIDLPLSALTVFAFWRHFRIWSHDKRVATNANLRARLPAARIKVAFLISVITAVCWFLNYPVWAVYIILLVTGAVIGLLFESGEPLMLILFAYLIREWSFGFPLLFLHPPPQTETAPHRRDPHSELLGVRGTVVAPLRPCGAAELNGQVFQVVSESGQLVDIGTTIVVCGSQNGMICVRAESEGP